MHVASTFVASLVLAATSSGCFSTSSSGPAGGDDASALADVVTIEDVSVCAATEACAVIGTAGVSFDTTTTCGPCDTCLASMCCGVATACLAPTDAGGTNLCEDLAECERACAASDAGTSASDASSASDGDDGGDDGGGDCISTCESAYDAATIAALDAFMGCYASSCASTCP